VLNGAVDPDVVAGLDPDMLVQATGVLDLHYY
jgi:hypothetical protein